MTRFVAGRVAAIGAVLLVVNAAAFATVSFLGLRSVVPGLRISAPELMSTYPYFLRALARAAPGLLTGDSGMTAIDVVLPALARSSVLLALALIVSVAIGVPLGYVSVDRQHGRAKGAAVALSLVGFSMPAFYLGIVLVFLSLWLSARSGLGALAMPVYGFGLDKHLVLPVIALAVRPTTEIARLTAELMADELGKDYVRTAMAKGLPPRLVMLHHAFRNVAASIFTALGNSARYLIGSLIVVELVFGWPGVGRALAHAIAPRTDGRPSSAVLHDPELVAALITALACLFLLIHFVTGAAARAVDPRQSGDGP